MFRSSKGDEKMKNKEKILSLQIDINDLQIEIEDLQSEIYKKYDLIADKKAKIQEIIKNIQIEVLQTENESKLLLDKLYKICDVGFDDDNIIKKLEQYLDYNETAKDVEQLSYYHSQLKNAFNADELKRVWSKIEMYLRFLMQTSFCKTLTPIQKAGKK